MKKKELKKPKEPNPFLNLINISKNSKNRYKTPIKQRIQYQRSFTPIELIKNKSSKYQKTGNKIEYKVLNTSISNFKGKGTNNRIDKEVEKLTNEIKTLKEKLRVKNIEYTKSKEEINKLKNENENLKNQVSQFKEKIENLSKEENRVGKETLLYHYFVEMNNQILQSLNENTLNLDNMTYEELLALEDKIGYVNKGFKKEDISKIKSEKYNSDDNVNCVICQEYLKKGDEIKKLNCNHLFHIKCIDTWLLKEKNCPFCKEEIIIPI
jgi:chromosome segregation ATPase